MTERPADLDRLRRVAGVRVLFCHQSVGANVLDGIGLVYASAGLEPPPIVEVGTPVAGPALLHATVGDNGDPLGKLAAFESVLGTLGGGVDQALAKFCYADVVAGTDVEALFAAYLATTQRLAEASPGVRLLHATVPVTAARGWASRLKAALRPGPDPYSRPANLARHRYNRLVRERFAGTGTLFDLAAVEAGGRPPAATRDGRRYEELDAALSADLGHLNPAGAAAAAAELIRVIAGDGGRA